MQQTSATARIMDYDRFMAIFNSRKPITTDLVAGGKVILSVQGEGTFFPKNDAKNSPFDKYIYNLKANSMLSVARAENKQLLKKALVAHNEGHAEEASALFNEYLNAVQISFNVPADRAQRFANGDDVKCDIELVETKDGQKQLVVRSVSKEAPKKIAARKFDITDLIDDEPAEGEILNTEKVTA
jgi:hypothetical protein